MDTAKVDWSMGSSAAGLLAFLAERGYRPHAFTGGRLAALAPEQALAVCRDAGYADLLFL